jgi:hypothetical protein
VYILQYSSYQHKKNIQAFGLTFLWISSSPLHTHPPVGERVHFPLQYPPEIITDTRMSEYIVHYNLNIRVMAYDTDFYYNARLCKR